MYGRNDSKGTVTVYSLDRVGTRAVPLLETQSFVLVCEKHHVFIEC
jgi:hypothetical protein